MRLSINAQCFGKNVGGMADGLAGRAPALGLSVKGHVTRWLQVALELAVCRASATLVLSLQYNVKRDSHDCLSWRAAWPTTAFCKLSGLDLGWQVSLRY